jgi:hypothetical protein
MKWSRDVQAGGCNEGQGCKMLPVGAFVEGELYLSWMQFFPSPFMPFILFVISFFIAFFFLFFCSRDNQGTLSWRGDQW